mgnify:CR=1 FL=1
MVGLFKMLGYAVKGALNPVTQVMVAGNASQIIENITGKPCSQGQLICQTIQNFGYEA